MFRSRARSEGRRSSPGRWHDLFGLNCRNVRSCGRGARGCSHEVRTWSAIAVSRRRTFSTMRVSSSVRRLELGHHSLPQSPGVQLTVSQGFVPGGTRKGPMAISRLSSSRALIGYPALAPGQSRSTNSTESSAESSASFVSPDRTTTQRVRMGPKISNTIVPATVAVKIKLPTSGTRWETTNAMPIAMPAWRSKATASVRVVGAALAARETTPA